MDAVLKHWKIFCFDDFTGNPKVLRNPCIWPVKKKMGPIQEESWKLGWFRILQNGEKMVRDT